MKIVVLLILLMVAGCGTYTSLDTPDLSVAVHCPLSSNKTCERRNGKLTRCWCQSKTLSGFSNH